jgi:hypothetical protein
VANLLLDTFAYSDGNLATVSGGAWAVDSGFGDLVIASGAVKPNASVDGSARLASWAGSGASQWAQVRLSVVANFNGPCVFHNGAGTFYFLDCRSDSMWLYEVVSGSFGSALTQDISAGSSCVAGDLVRLEVDYNGSTAVLRAYRNGVLRVSFTDNTPITGGRPGLRMYNGDQAARLDDFQAGDLTAAATAGSYAAAVLADSPSAYWPLQETSGFVAANALAGGVLGALTGGVTLAVPGPWATTTAMRFDGTTGKIIVPHGAFCDFGTGPLTLECWARIVGPLGGQAHLMDLKSDGTNAAGPQFNFVGPAAMYGRIVNAAAVYTDTAVGGLTIGGWDYWVLTLQRGAPDQQRLYRNGVVVDGPVTFPAGTDAGAAASMALGIGVDSGGTVNFLNGDVAHVAIYKTALSQAQIANHYALGPASTAPTIASLTPNHGAVGASITIAGTNFGATQGASTVTFNGTTATPSGWADTSITVPVPAGATTGNVVVTVGGVASNGSAFTVDVVPSITTLAPSSGVVGTSVTVTGTGFGATQGGSTITFNGTAASPSGWTATSITVPVPAGATTGDVVVTVGGLASAGKPFTVLVAPAITSLSPASGGIGAVVTITGTSFGASQGGSTVTFNGVPAVPSGWTATQITVPVPAGATTGPVVVTVGGVASNGVTFTVTGRPRSRALFAGDEDMVRYNWVVPVTPSNTLDLERLTDAVYIGGDGNLAVALENNVVQTFNGLVAGQIVPVVARRVQATGTTATNLLAMNLR